ncbi:type II secretion system F family protein [Roseivivax marinus]|uniref:type II secretion system F family protein n=1 Tax=Roseivivax marinus TaxID=1379903 RepID=UPI001F04C8C2|nr:type II secretion system F family protein [Roseivivax marinus]UMA65798.1 type II secretion system F family protein [Roseivivax marinus]
MSDIVLAEIATYAVYAAAFLGVFLTFSGLVQLLRRGETRAEARNRRMRLMEGGADTADILALLKPAEARTGLEALPGMTELPQALRQAGWRIGVRTFLALCAAAIVVVFAVAQTMIALPLALLAALILGGGAPVAVLVAARNARNAKLVAQLPDALDLLARGLRVGHPLNTSIGAVANEMPDPIGTEFGLIYDQVSFGDELTDAFTEFAERSGQEDVQYLAASINIQHGTGGDLARVISVLASVVRSRLSMRRRIKAISSEGRMSAFFLSGLPLFIFTTTMMSSPGYYGDVMDDPMFTPMMIIITTLVVLNALVLRKLVNFRI